MSVTKVTITGNDYWRVYRAWDGEPIQRYFRVDQPNERESYKKAVAEDLALRARQRAHMARKVFDLHYHILPDGKLRGVRRVAVKRAGRRTTEAYQVRIKLPWEEKPDFTSVSIDRHGVDGAFDKVVDYYCDTYGFDERSQMRSALRECINAYKTNVTLKTLPESVTEHKNDGDWVAAIEKEIQEFKARDRKMISGR